MKNDKTEQIQTKAPKVTVLMAVYNGERFLREAVKSILNQTFRDFEFLIINDGSTDRTRYILASYDDHRIRIVDNEKNIGLTKSLNRGLAMARGEYVARQDADDRSHPSRLEKQVYFMDKHPDVVLLGTQGRIIDVHGRVIKRSCGHKALSSGAIIFQLLFQNPFTHTSTLFHRKTILERFDGYNERYRYNQDFELWSRVIHECPTANLPDRLVDYRRNPFSITILTPEKSEAFQRNFSMNVAVQRRNICRVLGSDYRWEDWPELWSLVNVPYIFSDRRQTIDPEVLLSTLSSIKQRFCEMYGDAMKDPEIRLIISNVYFGLADYFAPRMPRGALKIYRCGTLLSFFNGVRHLPKFAVKLLRLEFVYRRIAQDEV